MSTNEKNENELMDVKKFLEKEEPENFDFKAINEQI